MKVRPAERVFLLRERAQLTQPRMAKRFGLTTDEWRSYETGTFPAPPRYLMMNGKVMPWELMKLKRRRHGLSIKKCAARMGISHVTLIQHERGYGDWQLTYGWWAVNERDLK